MKTIKNYGRMFLLAVLMMGVVSSMNAQGKGHGRDNNPGRGHDKENRGREKVSQGRGHDKKDFKDRDHDRDNHGRDNWDKNRDSDRDRYARNDRDRHYDRHYSNEGYRYRKHVTYNYHRYRRPVWAPVYGHRYNTRYIYYNDYNVYYDCHRDLFLLWTGRRWVVSYTVPNVLVHVNFNRTIVTGVDYWDDDFDNYLERRRPVFVSIRAEF